jgi:hypothetical protein
MSFPIAATCGFGWEKVVPTDARWTKVAITGAVFVPWARF